MDRKGPLILETLPTVREHYLKDELYNRLSSDPAIFEFLQAGSLDGIWYWDIDEPEQEWMSPRLKEVFGYQDHEVPNTSAWWQQNIFPEDLAIALDNFNRHCADPNHPYDQIVRYRHKNGSTVWVRCRGMAIRDASGRPIRMLGAHTDVTAMKRTEERLRALYEASPDMYFVADLQTGAIGECNQALLDNTGHARISGASFLNLCHSESVKTANSVLRSLQTQPEVRDVELRFQRKNGTSFAVLLSANTISNHEAGRRGFRAWCRDISHLKRFANVEVLLSALPIGVLLADGNGLISSSNPSGDSIFGYQKGELAGKPLCSLLADSSRLADVGSAAKLNLRGLRKDGSVFPIHLELSTLPLGEGTFQIATVADLTARQSMETALRESEHRFRQLTESLPQLVWTCTPAGTCDYLSPQWVAYTGVPAEEQLDLGWIQQIHPDDRNPIMVAWSASVGCGEPLKFDYRVRRHDGAYRWFEACAIPLRNVENQVVKWFGSSTDVHERREGGAALEREQERLANLVMQAPAVFCSFALRPDGSAFFPYASPDIFNLYGVHPDDLKKDARHLFALVPKEDLAPMHASIAESARAMRPWSLQFRVLHPTKGERWIEGHSTPALESDGTIIWHGFLQDITERKRVESDEQFLFQLGAALQTASSPEEIAQASTQLMAFHFDVARCTFNSIDSVRGETTLLHEHVIQGPPSASRTYPLTAWGNVHLTDLLATGTTLAIHRTATDPFTIANYASAFHPAGIESLVAIPLRRSGMWVSVICLLSPVPRQWSQREIDVARSAAERIWPAYEAARALAAERTMHQTLRVSEERLRMALQSAAIGIWEWYPITGKNIWDARSKFIFGFPLDFTPATDVVMSCVHPDDREALQQHIDAYTNPAGSGHFEAEYRIYTWNTMGLRHIFGQGQMYFEGEGDQRRPVRAIGTIQDITALKQGEQALRRVNLELEQFAYAAAHDLQEPLRNVGLATQILASRYKGQFDSDAQNLLQIAVEGPVRMQAMVKDLLAYSRALTIEDGTSLFANSNEVLSLALRNLLASIQEKQAQITWEKLPNVRMSELHLLQVFQNLIGNSLKYSGPRQPLIHVSATRRSGECVLSVRDNGTGIPPELHERAFGVFKRLHNHRNVSGTGIGLALCKRIVEHYGGKIWIESNVGAGTTVLFTPPLAEEKADTAT